MRPSSFRSLPMVLAVAVALGGCTQSERVSSTQSLVRARTLGLHYLQNDLLADAEAQFKTVVALAPNEALGYTNLGLTYLRAGRISEAETQAVRARALDSASTTIVLLLASVYRADGRDADAHGLLEGAVRDTTSDPALLYALVRVDTTPTRTATRASLLRRIVALTPTNVAVRLDLLGTLVELGAADGATRALEEIRRLPPEPPAEALVHYARVLPLLRSRRFSDARASLARFREAMELTSAFQSGLAQVAGPSSPMVGRPELTFSPRFELSQRATRLGAAIQDAVTFVDATSDAGLGGTPNGQRVSPAAVAVGDYDGDGSEDLFVSQWDPTTDKTTARLYRADAGILKDVSAASRLFLAGGARWATFADTDNDGHLDLFVIDTAGRGRLFRNTGQRRFTDVTARSGLGDVGSARKALFVDLDHDGDLDLVAVGPLGVRVMRNASDGTFTDATAEFGLEDSRAAHDLAFADLNDDGRVDLLVSREGAGATLYRNAGARRFEDATAASGLAVAEAVGSVAVGDFDNDGAFDLFFVAGDAERPSLWRGHGDATFRRASGALAASASLDGLVTRAAQFLDYDNDGWLDLLLAGSSADTDARKVVLLRNRGNGNFEDRSALLQRTPGNHAALATFDLGRDGDLDVVVAGSASGPRLLRNDGGNANLFVQVRLAGLRTGSGKNNDFGIGAKVELRVGDIVQTRIATGPVTHFGLGAHLKADVLRVEWPNGVPQVIHFPGSDQDVLENEVFKSSCGFLYAWDGERFAFVTDVMWRSALGMPLGIMGGDMAWAPPAASQEYLRVPGRALQARNGRYLLQLTEELWETSYTDEIRLLAVDHPDSVELFVDERFVPPGPVALRMHQPVRGRPPRSAVDGNGVDLLPALREKDDVYVSNLVPLEYQGIVESHDLVMDLGEAAGQPGTHLYLRGWIYPTDASINVALSQQTRIKPVMPVLEVRDAAGAWRPAAEIGFPSGKDKTIVVDLVGIFPTRDRHVRIRTNMQIYWDQIFIAADSESSPRTVTIVPLLSADLHFRGISRTYRKGGRYGPHWFDYADVITEPVWRPIPGRVTRFGDVLPLLREADDQYIVMAPGDETTLQFDATATPPLPAGWTRDFLIYSDGWIKDSDLNTALGNRVEPLPFHGMTQYPAAPGDRQPNGAAYRRYLREYNTRVIGSP